MIATTEEENNDTVNHDQEHEDQHDSSNLAVMESKVKMLEEKYAILEGQNKELVKQMTNLKSNSQLIETYRPNIEDQGNKNEHKKKETVIIQTDNQGEHNFSNTNTKELTSFPTGKNGNSSLKRKQYIKRASSKLNKKPKTLIKNKSTSIIQNNSEKIKDYFLNEKLLTGVKTIKLTNIKVEIILTFVMECWKHEEGIFYTHESFWNYNTKEQTTKYPQYL